MVDNEGRRADRGDRLHMFLISWPGGSWEATLKSGIVFVVIFLSAFWIATVFWTYRDIRQRTRDPILQTAAVLLVLIFNFPGHWIYLIVRPRQTLTDLYERSLEEEALLQELEDQKACPTCKRRVKDEFLVCPRCRTQLKEACRQCSKPLSYAWVACPYCGLEKPPREGFAPRPVRTPAVGECPGPAAARRTASAGAGPGTAGTAEPANPAPSTVEQPHTGPPGIPFGTRGRAAGAAEDGPVIGE